MPFLLAQEFNTGSTDWIATVALVSVVKLSSQIELLSG